MNNAIKLFFGLILLASMVSASNISIDSVSSVPANTLWTASISYELNSDNDAKVFLDNELLITVFDHDGKAFVDNTQNSSKVLNYNATSGELTLSIAGMQKGEYSLEAKLYSGINLLDSADLKIQFYNWQDKINSLESTVNSQYTLIQTLRNDLNAKTSEIENLKISNQLTIDSLKQINSSITNLQENDFDKNASIEKINVDLNKLTADKNASIEKINMSLNKLLVGKEIETGVTGFFGFATNPVSIVTLLGILALIGVGVVLYNNKKNKGTLY